MRAVISRKDLKNAYRTTSMIFVLWIGGESAPELGRCKDLVVLEASSTCTNELTGEDLCAGHVSGGGCD